MRKIVVTGGAGFIGSNFARYYLERYSDARVHVLDALTYAGNTANFEDLHGFPRFQFTNGSICDAETVRAVCNGADAVVNFAAETHVDRSIVDAGAFIQTDIAGVHVLLEYQRTVPSMRLLHVSTDEVYGAIENGSFTESDPLNPSSPYSASKAGGEMMAKAYHTTYGSDVVVTRGSNTFGPYQYPEKLIPLFITNLIDDIPVPVYGDGQQVRDWLYVEDHCKGIDIALEHGKSGEAYNIGGGNERTNLEITANILGLLGKDESFIRHVPDRPGHDRRYSVDTSKLQGLGFQRQRSFAVDLQSTVEWYRTNQKWWRATKEKQEEYKSFMQAWYADRS